MNIDDSAPEYWLLITMLFAILANVSTSPVPVYLGGASALVAAGGYLSALRPIIGGAADAD